MKLLIKSGTVVTCQGEKKLDILVEDSQIVKIDSNLDIQADEVISAKDKYVLPGFIDLHAHLRTPGREDEEDLYSASQAAVKGGFTTICCMPNTEPPLDNEGLIYWIKQEAKKIGKLEILPIATITKQRQGKQLSEFGALASAGCKALSDDGDSVENSLIMRRALEYAKMYNLLIISHCEDKNLALGAIRESKISSRYGIKAIPSIAESLVVARDIELAKYTKGRLHLAHVSTKRSVELIREAKEKGVNITAETAPHYLCLNIEDIVNEGFHSNWKVNPPLGEKEDNLALLEGLLDGTIDCIATDHAPHSPAEKEMSFEQAPFGMIGLEFAFSIINTYLIKKEKISLGHLVKFLSYNPAKILNFTDRGEIEIGKRADITIVDLDKKWRIEKESIASKSQNTPFLGKELVGKIWMTIFQGKVVYKDNG